MIKLQYYNNIIKIDSEKKVVWYEYNNGKSCVPIYEYQFNTLSYNKKTDIAQEVIKNKKLYKEIKKHVLGWQNKEVESKEV